MRAPLLALLLFALLPGCDRIAARADPLLAEVQSSIDVAGSTGSTDPQYRKADTVLARALGDPRFPYSSKDDQGQIVVGAAWAALRVDDDKRARDLFRRATGLQADNWQSWRMLARLERRLDNHDAAVAAMLRALKGSEVVDARDERELVLLTAEAKAGSAPDLELMQWLFDHQWTSDDPYSGGVWLRLARERLARGQRDAAKAALARITTPIDLVSLRADKRFDGLYDPAAVEFDPREMAMRRAAHLEAEAGRQPRSLQARHRLARALLAVGLADAALRVTEEALAEAGQPGTFDDLHELTDVEGARAATLLQLGRVNEALALRQSQVQRKDPGADEILNLADLYCELGRGKDARETALRARDLSDYGRMNQAYQLHCAAVQLGDAAAARQQLQYLAAHRADAHWTYLSALLREDRGDEAARALVAWLEDENDRGDALHDIQHFKRVEPLSPDAARMRERWDALLERPDVQAAVDRVGRRQAYDLFG